MARQLAGQPDGQQHGTGREAPANYPEPADQNKSALRQFLREGPFSARREGQRHPLTLPEQIAEDIFAAIMNGEIALGQRIREDELARQYHVSRGPVREALRLLEKDAVVVILPHRGAHVSRLNATEVNNIFAIRKALISLAIREFTTISPAVQQAMDEIVTYMESIVADPAAGNEYSLASARLHMLIADQSGNQHLRDMILSLARQTFRYTRIALSTAQTRQRSVTLWRQVVEQFENGNLNNAADLAGELIERSCAAASAALHRAADDQRA